MSKFQEVARLASKHFADCPERREAHGPSLAGLQDGEVSERDVKAFGELIQRHAPVMEQVVKLHDNGHQTVPSRSSRMRVPSRNTCASTNSMRMASQPVTWRLPFMRSGNSLVETADAIATTQMCSSSRPSIAQAMVRSRPALSLVNATPERTDSTILRRRLNTM